MILGLIADTHDNVKGIHKALDLFRLHRVDRILHLGDLSQPETAWELTGLPVSYILGNNELELVSLRRTLQAVGIEYLGEQATLTIDEKIICLYHGTRQTTLKRLLNSQEYDYILKGHSHQVEDYRVGRTRVLNPGAVWGTRSRTVALFEPSADKVKILEVAT